MALQIKKATRQKKKIRFALSGVSGAGKTFSALKMATELVRLLCPGETPRILLGDTEHESSTCYADGNPFEFDLCPLDPPFHPHKLIEFLQLSKDYHVAICDSMSHFHMGQGGLLEIHDAVTKRMRGNSFAAWKEVTPLYNDMIESIIRCPAHLFGTLRAKSEYVQTEENGKKSVQKVGLSAQMRDGFEFEFDHHGRIDIGNSMVIEKTRCSELNDRVFNKPGKEIAEILARWCSTGTDAHDLPPLDPRESQRPAYIAKIMTLADQVGAIESCGVVLAADTLNLASMDTLLSIGKQLKEAAENYGEQTDDTAA